MGIEIFISPNNIIFIWRDKMPTNDIRSDLEPKLVQLDTITGDTVTDGFSIDTSDFDGGIVFNFIVTAFSAGTFTPILEESDTGLFSGEENAIADANLIGTEAGAVLTIATAEGDVLKSIGIFGTKKFVRSTISSSGASGTNTIVVMIDAAPEIMPSPNLSA